MRLSMKTACLIIVCVQLCACNIDVIRKDESSSLPSPTPEPSPSPTPGSGGSCVGQVIPKVGAKAWSKSGLNINKGQTATFCVNIEGVKKITSGMPDLFAQGGTGIRFNLTQVAPRSQTCGCQGPFDEYGMPADYNSCAMIGQRAVVKVKKDDVLIANNEMASAGNYLYLPINSGLTFYDSGLGPSYVTVKTFEKGWYQFTVTNKTQCKPFEISVGIYGSDYVPE